MMFSSVLVQKCVSRYLNAAVELPFIQVFSYFSFTFSGSASAAIKSCMYCLSHWIPSIDVAFGFGLKSVFDSSSEFVFPNLVSVSFYLSCLVSCSLFDFIFKLCVAFAFDFNLGFIWFM